MGGVGERHPAGNVPGRVDTRRAGDQMIVGDDAAALVHPYPGGVQAQVIGDGLAAGGHQQVPGGDLTGAAGQPGRVEDLDGGVANADQPVAFQFLEHLVQGWPLDAEHGGQGALRQGDLPPSGLLS